MVQIIKRDYTQFSSWECRDCDYTDYNIVINGKKSYFHRVRKDAKDYQGLSRHEMAVRLMYFRKTGYKYVDCNIPSMWQSGCTISERFDFIRKNGYTPTDFAALYWNEALNCWCFHGNLNEYSYVWSFLIYSRDVVDSILEELKTLPKAWRKMKIEL